MRNLKRVLSLALAALMLMGMMVVGAGAASKDFTDSDEIKNVEAVDVMVALGVLEGGDKGDFQPNSILTREQAAKIICYMLLGEEAAEKLTTNYSIFSDVPANRWSAPYISYCVNLGILAGDGAGHFYPEGKLTGVAFAKMLLVCLGYSAERENYVGNNWEINVSAAAIAAGVAPKALDLSKELSRQDAAQMAFNTLTATMVEYLNDNTIIIGGETIISTTGKASAVKQYPYEDTMNTEYLQFAEKYFGKLKKLSTADEFDRPAHTWNYMGEEVGTFVDWDLMVGEYTTGITGKELYELLTATTIKNYGFTYYVDGKVDTTIKASNMIRTNTTKYPTTGNGALTQVFVNTDTEEVVVTTINTFLAEATADYNEKKETLSLDVKQRTPAPYSINSTVSVNDVAGIENYKEGNFVLVTVAEAANGKYDIITVAAPETMTDTKLTKYSTGSYVVADGTQYDYAKEGTNYNAAPLQAYDKTALTNYTYNIYLDQYGYVIGTEIYSGEANYLFLTGYDLNGSNLAVTTATAGAIFLDGTFKEIQVNVTDTDKNLDKDGVVGADDATNYPLLRGAGKQSGTSGDSEYNMWFTYTTSEKNGETVYTLSPVANWTITDAAASGTTTKINSASVRVVDSKTGDRAYGNDDSVYLTVDTGKVDLSSAMGITKVTGTYTGVQNVDLKVFNKDDNDLTVTYKTNEGSIFAVYDEDLYIIGAIVVGEDANSTDNYAYVLDDAENEYIDSDDNYYWDFKAVVDGEIKTLTVKTKYSSVISAIQAQIGAGKNGLMTLTYDADGYVIGAQTVKDSDPNVYGDTDFGKDTDPNLFNVYTLQYDNAFGLKKSADFMVAGRTLYGHTSDAGLTLETNAPVIVVQEEKPTVGNAKLTYTAYSTISQALAALKDSGDFEGWVSAVLNDKGTAEYIVLNSKDAIGITTDDPTVGTNYNIKNETLTKNSNGTLHAAWNLGSAYGSTYTATAKFYLVKDGVNYLLDTATYTGAMGTTGNYLNSTVAIAQNGNYYAVITITDSTGAVVDSATTDVVTLAY